MKVLLIVGLISIPLFANADLSPSEITAKQIQNGKDHKNLGVQRINLEKKMIKLEKIMARLKQEAESAVENWEMSQDLDVGGDSGNSEYKKIMEKAQRELANGNQIIAPGIRKAKQKLARVGYSIDVVDKELVEQKFDAQNQLGNLRSELEQQKLTLEFTKLEHRLENTDDTLDEMEKVYDKSLLGTYVQDKIGQLLNSISICKARRRCATKDPTKIPADYIRAELFPNSKSRSGYYDKVKKRRDKMRSSESAQ